MKGFSLFLVVATGFVLSSCGGGGGGGSNGGGGGGSGGPMTPNGEPMGTVEGIAHDGPINNAVVTAYAWNGSKGAVLGSAPTDFQGRYTLPLQAASQPLLLEVTGGFYVDESTFKQVSLDNGQTVLGLIDYRSGQRQSAMVTYYTTLAAGLAERLVRNGTGPSDAVTAANQRISAFVGVDVVTVQPADITRSDLGSVSPSVAYGFATAAVSSFTDFVATSNAATPRTTSIQFIQFAYDDIRADGVLDGRGTNGDLFVGTMPLTSEVYRHELALHVLRLADNPSTNFSRIKVADLVPTAKALNDSTDGIFASMPVVELASDVPNIAAVSLADKAVIFGRTSISLTVASVAGINRVDAQLVDESQKVVVGPVAAADPKNPIITIDTTTIPDGAYQLTLNATDTAGAISSKTLSVTVNNQPVIDNVSLPTDRPVGGTQIVTATLNDPLGLTKVEYFYNGMLDASFPSVEFPNPRTPYTLNTRRFPDGQQTLRIVITNQTAGTFSKDVTFRSDNTAPTLAEVTPTAGAFIRQARGPSGEELIDQNGQRVGFVITGTTADRNGVSSVEALVNDISLGTRPALPFSIPIQPDGVKRIVLRVRDFAGNVIEDVRQVTFDATPSAATIESPLASQVSGQIRVLGSGRDNIFLSSLRLGVVETERNLEIGCFGGETGDSGAGGRYILTFDTSAFTNGNYQLTLYARDQAGNESTSQPLSLSFNNTPARTAPNQGNATPKCFISP